MVFDAVVAWLLIGPGITPKESSALVPSFGPEDAHVPTCPRAHVPTWVRYTPLPPRTPEPQPPRHTPFPPNPNFPSFAILARSQSVTMTLPRPNLHLSMTTVQAHTQAPLKMPEVSVSPGRYKVSHVPDHLLRIRRESLPISLVNVYNVASTTQGGASRIPRPVLDSV